MRDSGRQNKALYPISYSTQTVSFPAAVCADCLHEEEEAVSCPKRKPMVILMSILATFNIFNPPPALKGYFY